MKRLNIETFLEYNFLSEVAISPCGKHTAFIVSNAEVEENKYVGQIYLMCNESGKTKQLTSKETVRGFFWEDDENIIFPSSRCKKTKEKLKNGEEITTYYKININGGEAQKAFEIPLLVGNIKKIQANKFLVSAKFDNNRPNIEGMSEIEKKEVLAKYNEKSFTVFEEIPFWGNAQGIINRKRNRLYVFDVLTNSVQPLTAPMFNVMDFKNDDKKVVFTGAEYDDVRPLYSGLYVYNFETQTTKCLIEPKTYGIKSIALYGEKEIIMVGTDNKKFGMGEYGDIYSIDIATGEKSLITKHNFGGIGNNSTNSDVRYGGGNVVKIDNEYMYYLTTKINNGFLNRVSLKSGEIEVLSDIKSVDSFDVLGDKIMMVGQEINTLAEIYCLNDEKCKKMTGFNEFVVKEYTLTLPEPLTCINRENMEIYGYVMKPVGYVEGNSYPAILHIHGGPRTVFSDIYHHEMQLWANEGYFVIYCNPRGGDGRGNEFGDIRAKYGTIDYNDLMDFTDKAIEKYSDIDAKRLGVTGGSYGGFMTNWIIGHTNKFKCAVSQRSIANWTSFEGTTDIGYYFAPDQTGASHEENQEQQWQQSPLKYAHNVVTPTLFIHAEEDYRCWMVEALQMFTALKMHNVDSRLCLLKGDNHELSRSGKPKNRIKRMEEIVAWMNKYLK